MSDILSDILSDDLSELGVSESVWGLVDMSWSNVPEGLFNGLLDDLLGMV